MPKLPEPNNDSLKGLPNTGLPSNMASQRTRIVTANEYFKSNNPEYAKQIETIENDFLNSKLYEISKTELSDKQKEEYLKSEYRLQMYKSVSQSDSDFNIYLKNMYGNISNFFEANTDLVENKTFNPRTDFLAEVSIITKDHYYKSDFISMNEVILEMLNGVCTVEYFKINGQISRLTTTLDDVFVPDSQNDVRRFAFGGLPGKRVLCWDLIKEKWSSFYMKNLKRFIRDETSGLE
jgi:hypothetical protein